jgi:hypothetical protein
VKFVAAVAGMIVIMAHQHYEAPPVPVKYQLTLVVYASDRGHMVKLGSYVASFRIKDFATEEACEDEGNAALKGFQSEVLSDGARTLPAYICDEVKT